MAHCSAQAKKQAQQSTERHNTRTHGQRMRGSVQVASRGTYARVVVVVVVVAVLTCMSGYATAYPRSLMAYMLHTFAPFHTKPARSPGPRDSRRAQCPREGDDRDKYMYGNVIRGAINNVPKPRLGTNAKPRTCSGAICSWTERESNRQNESVRAKIAPRGVGDRAVCSVCVVVCEPA